MPTMQTWEAACLPQIKVFNNTGPVALCTLWNEGETHTLAQAPELATMDRLSVMGNLRTPLGIGWFLRGLHKFPQIKLVLIWGRDGLETGKAIQLLWERGIGSGHTIPDKGWPIDELIPAEAINALRESIQLRDIRHVKLRELAGYIRGLEVPVHLPARSSVEFPPVPLPELDTLPAEPLSLFFREPDPGRVWLKILASLLQYGDRRMTRKGEKIVHYVGIHGVFPVPEEDDPASWFGMTREDADLYIRNILSPIRPPGVDYWYGERLQAWAGRNQLEEVIARLKKDGDTKRGSIAVLEPEDLETLEDAPCLTGITYSIVRGQLVGLYKFRSHDMHGGWPNNVMALMSVHREVARRIGVGLGRMEVISENAQIYDTSLPAVKAWVENQGFTFEHGGRFAAYRPDPVGAFIFTIVDEDDRKVVQAELRNIVGDRVLWTKRHPSPDYLVRWIVESMSALDPQHVRHLGEQIPLLERALKTGEPYKQD